MVCKYRYQNKGLGASFFLKEEGALAVTLDGKKGTKTLVYHDHLRKKGERYCLFHEKSVFLPTEDGVEIRTAAVSGEDQKPVAGLLVSYRFSFFPEEGAYYLSVSYESDDALMGYSSRLMDLTWEGFSPCRYTGYEYDALGRPFSQKGAFPQEKNPLAPDYETLMRIRPHEAWERMKTRPVTFRRALAVEGETDGFAVLGGTPTLNLEIEFVSVFTQMPQYTGDLRFFSGANAVGAWFLYDLEGIDSDRLDRLEEKSPCRSLRNSTPAVEDAITVTSGALSFTLLRSRSGVRICPISDQAGEAMPMPLFYLTLWDTKYEREVTLAADDHWERVSYTRRPSSLCLTFADPESGTIRGITVIAEAYLEPKSDRISWKMRVVNTTERYSLLTVSYPVCPACGFDTAYNSSNAGTEKARFPQHCGIFYGKYPTGCAQNMAFSAVYRPFRFEEEGKNGLYIGLHDPDGQPKFMSLAGAPLSRMTAQVTTVYAKYPKQAGNSFTLPGAMVWQRFRGDWFDAAEIYREFVHQKADWLSPVRGRYDSPDWIRKMPVWIMHFMPNENPDANPFPITLREKYSDQSPEDWYRLAVRFATEIGTPVAYHLYNWHWVPFNNDNPHYFPTHHDLKQGMAELKKANIRVIPYMAGYSWDMCDGRGDDFRFQTEAMPATAKDENGNVIYTSYASKEPTGQAVRFARMCPTTPLWKNEVLSVVKRLAQDYGMDGIYLDVVSTAYEQCCDPTHLHEQGYGDFWRRGYEELFALLRAETPESFALVSESTSEVYTGSLDGLLSWQWVQVDGVPAYVRVYGGRANLFGRVFTLNNRDNNDYFCFQIAQSLVWGQQLGWLHPEIVQDPIQFPFLKKLSHLRWEKADFFAEAEMLRPPVVEGEMALLNSTGFLRSQLLNHEKMVQAGGFENAQGERMLVAVNAASVPADVTLTVSEEEYGLVEKMTHADGILEWNKTVQDGRLVLSVKMAPYAVGVWEWKK